MKPDPIVAYKHSFSYDPYSKFARTEVGMLMLHSRLLQYIDEVARCGSVRAAGANLHVAPSAINRQILLFEQELGQPLFTRLPRGMRPTPAGEVLLSHIRQTVQQYRETLAVIRDLGEVPSGEVVIATTTGLASGVVSSAVARFHNHHRQVRVAIRAMSSTELLRSVENSEADLGLGFNLPPSAHIDVCWRMNTRLGAVIAPEHPLAHMESIPLAQCASYPLIFAERSMAIHGIIADAFAEAGIETEPAFHTNSIESMKRLAATGDAIAFLSNFDIADELREGELTFRPIRDRAFANNLLSLIRREVRRDTHNRGVAALLLAEEITDSVQAAMLYQQR